jgi:hypothetical protein
LITLYLAELAVLKAGSNNEDTLLHTARLLSTVSYLVSVVCWKKCAS